MRIGRLEIGIAKGFSQWAIYKGLCGCHFVDIGRFYILWSDKNCKCNVCGKYTCICPEGEK